MSRIKKLVFHIGVPKTGSSLLQKCLRNLRRKLRRRGVTYIDRNVFLRIPSYTAWAAYGRDEHPKQDFFDAFLAQVERKRRVRGEPTDTVLISNEAASGRSRDLGVPFWPGGPPGIGEIIELLDPESTELVVYVRRQDKLLESLFMQRIHRGASVMWATHRDKVCLDDRVRYSELLDGVSTLPTVDRLRVRPFEIIQAGSAAFVADFLSIIDSGDLITGLPSKALLPTNPSYTHAAWEAATALNPLLDRPGQAKRVRKFLSDLFPTDAYPKAQLFTDEERLAVIERYRPDNEQVFEKYLPEFPVDTYSTVDGVNQLRGFLTPITIPTPPPPPKRSAYRRVRAAVGTAWRGLRG